MTELKTFIVVLTAGFVSIVNFPQSGRAADNKATAISGIVFHDANGNSKQDKGEKGLSGIRVTDGVGFAVTDDRGAYSISLREDYMIPFTPARTVSVCWPSGKWPTGRWWYRLSEIENNGEVHFGLREEQQKLPFVFLQTSDDHGNGNMYSDIYAHDVRLMKPKPRFLFNTGDMGYATPKDAEKMFSSVRDHADAFPVTMFFTPGNHDFVPVDPEKPLDQQPLSGWGAYTKHLGPVRWSFDYGGVHFVSIDYMEKAQKGHVHRIPRLAVKFLEKDLSYVAKATRVILLVHCYDAPVEFYRALHRLKIDQMLCGHTHMPIFARVGGVPAITNYGVGTGIVTSDSIDMVERRPLLYVKGLLLEYFKSVTEQAMKQRREKKHGVVDKTLASSTLAVNGSPSTESVEIILKLLPGGAGKAGLRIGKKETIEILFDGDTVNVAGTPVPFRLIQDDIEIPLSKNAPKGAKVRRIPADRSLRWHILIDRDRISIMGNDLFRLSKAVKIDYPAFTSLVAEDGGATFAEFEMWELRTIKNRASRNLHHFPPPAWKWGKGQYVRACLDDGSDTAKQMLGRVSADGIKDYDIRK